MRIIALLLVLLAQDGGRPVGLLGTSVPVAIGTAWQATPLPRSRAVIRQFARQTGYPSGRPGWVVDHKIPLCAGGPQVDVMANLQWQERIASYRKDVFERQLCAYMKKQGLVMTATPQNVRIK